MHVNLSYLHIHKRIFSIISSIIRANVFVDTFNKFTRIMILFADVLKKVR